MTPALDIQNLPDAETLEALAVAMDEQPRRLTEEERRKVEEATVFERDKYKVLQRRWRQA